VTDIPEDEPSLEAPAEPARAKGVDLISIESELKRSYLDYAMSVIVSRALPDARDGLKPVHRRVLFSMHENGFTHDKPYRKSARVVGDVIGKYHPHGDQSIYMALVRLAQDFSMSLRLLDGQGNFGSVDGDMPAAMRYTEVRMLETASYLLAGIDEETVAFQPNYDGSELEPSVLPAAFPNLLVNGAGGIAVGMATNIPPHNLGEICDAAIALLDDPTISDLDLLEIVPGPDFPTGAQIIGHAGSRNGLLTGRGSVIVRGKAHIESAKSGRDSIVITEIPYQVNKATLCEKIAELVREKTVEGIAELRDESDREGMRVVVEVKRDASPEIVLNQLYRFTTLQSTFSVNMLALVGGRPLQLGLKGLLQAFLRFREEVITKRTRFRLGKARDRGHVLVGLAIAVANIDDVVALIRAAPDAATAREQLMARDWPAKDLAPLIALIADPRSLLSSEGTVRLSEDQARAILDLRLARLTGLGREEIGNEARALVETIQDLLDILKSRARVVAIIKDTLIEVKDKFAVPRRTVFIEADSDMDDEDLIEREDMVVTVTHGGYVKRTPLSTYRSQRRGGRGRTGMETKDEDAVTRLFVASTHTPVLFFSSNGQVYKEKVWRLPLGDPRARGKALVNLLPLDKGEGITTVMPLPEDEAAWGSLDVMFATRRGEVRRNKLSDFVQVNRNGKIAMKFEQEGDGIVDVVICTENDDVLLTTALGRCIRFSVADLRVFMSRSSTGVRGISLGEGDEVIAMSILRSVDATPAERSAYLKYASAMRRAELGDEAVEGESVAVDDDADDDGGEGELTEARRIELGAAEQFVLTVAEEGLGKRASSYDYRRSGRGGRGLIAHDLTRKGGRLVASFPVEQGDEIMMVTDGGQLIRTSVDDIRIAARGTQGVLLIRTQPGERVVAVERLADMGDNGAEEAGPSVD